MSSLRTDNSVFPLEKNSIPLSLMIIEKGADNMFLY